jgi:cell division transport system permease protein
LSVYLSDEATDGDRAAIERLLAPGGVVERYEYVSKPQALERFRETFADLADVIESLDGNPLPASYEVGLRSSDAYADDAETLATRLRAASGVADVRYDRQWLDRLMSAARVARLLGFALTAILTTAAALTVANVIRLALYARRDELEIMELVGAPRVYIRGPFVMEGVLQGGAGALLAVAALAVAFLAVHARYLVPLAGAINVSSIRFLSPELCAFLLAGGMMVGCLGGLVAARGRG